MKLLAFDTSNQAMSVALVEDTHLIAEHTINIRRNHSIQLMPTIEQLMCTVNWQLTELDRIVVAEGPGSYTGLRIAATTAKTLAWSLQIDLVGVSSLAALAQNVVVQPDTLISPLFDARRGNFYTGLYQTDTHGQVHNVEPDTHIAFDDWLEFLQDKKQPIIFIGDDVWKVAEVIKNALGEKAKFSPMLPSVPVASQLAKLGAAAEPVEVHTFVPRYLKRAEAEVNWLKRHSLAQDEKLVEKY